VLDDKTREAIDRIFAPESVTVSYYRANFGPNERPR
jgi:hypothetical protein